MQNHILAWIGLTIAGVAWMTLIIGSFAAEIPENVFFSPPRDKIALLVSAAQAALLGGFVIAIGGLYLVTTERPTTRRRKNRSFTADDFRYRTVVRREPQIDGRTKYYYEGGETEIH